jgi:methanogenic corrinoid protein MtbC1
MSELHDGILKLEPHSARRKRLLDLIVALDERRCLTEIADMLSSGWDPMDLLDSCIQGMRLIGKRFEEGRYFIAALIMAGAIMRQATELIEPHLVRRKSFNITGVMLLGTIAGDIHDLGKDLFALLVRCIGFEVLDLGVNVQPTSFLLEAERVRPDLIGISCALTNAVPELRCAVEMLHTELPAPRPPVIIGGTCIDRQICRHVQADYCAQDATQGMKVCRELLETKTHTIPPKPNGRLVTHQET